MSWSKALKTCRVHASLPKEISFDVSSKVEMGDKEETKANSFDLGTEDLGSWAAKQTAYDRIQQKYLQRPDLRTKPEDDADLKSILDRLTIAKDPKEPSSKSPESKGESISLQNKDYDASQFKPIIISPTKPKKTSSKKKPSPAFDFKSAKTTFEDTSKEISFGSDA
eukprot:TRINITY_DN2982_c0_g1_i1.p1 TRINITY_DN2982_c0_g1~~TRINITY_DN2982_c0_g1_i1.p1  ORF type:complete len:167 (-),score=47.58 TRINITY_DN2982_c0_g1_i1:118-618(-)